MNKTKTLIRLIKDLEDGIMHNKELVDFPWMVIAKDNKILISNSEENTNISVKYADRKSFVRLLMFQQAAEEDTSV